MKDFFSGGDDDLANFLNLYKEQDMHLIIEMVGFDDSNKVEYVLGEYHNSILRMIQK